MLTLLLDAMSLLTLGGNDEGQLSRVTQTASRIDIAGADHRAEPISGARMEENGRKRRLPGSVYSRAATKPTTPSAAPAPMPPSLLAAPWKVATGAAVVVMLDIMALVMLDIMALVMLDIMALVMVVLAAMGGGGAALVIMVVG